jgi:hypothetical protein
MTSKILTKFEQVVMVETGDRYVSDLGDLDVGIGNHLMGVINALKEFNGKKYPNFHSFAQRKASEKLFHSTEADPKRFIRQVRQRFFGKDGEKNQANRNALPLIYFHRAGGMDQSVSGEESLIKDMFELKDEAGKTIAIVDQLPTTATYMLYVLSWDQPTMDKLVAGIAAGLAINPRKLTYLTGVLNATDQPEASISPVHSSSWIDMSPANIDDRLLVYQLTIEVKASYYQARCVTEHTIRFEVVEPEVLYGASNVL